MDWTHRKLFKRMPMTYVLPACQVPGEVSVLVHHALGLLFKVVCGLLWPPVNEISIFVKIPACNTFIPVRWELVITSRITIRYFYFRVQELKYHGVREHEVQQITRGTVILSHAELLEPGLPGFSSLVGLGAHSDSSPTWLLRSHLRPPDKHAWNNASFLLVFAWTKSV